MVFGAQIDHSKYIILIGLGDIMMKKKQNLGMLLLTVLLLFSMGASCKKISDPFIYPSDCVRPGGHDHNVIFTGTSVNDFYKQVRDIQPQSYWNYEQERYFEMLTVFPAPLMDPPESLFGCNVLKSDISMYIWVNSSPNASIKYYYQLTLDNPFYAEAPDTQTSEFPASISYSFNRFLRRGNEICEDVQTLKEKWVKYGYEWTYTTGETADGTTYHYEKKAQDIKVLFDLNPGIGSLDVYLGMRTPIEGLCNQLTLDQVVPLFKWQLISKETGETITDQVGWW